MTPQVRDIALSLMAALDCPRSLMVTILIRYEEWEQLASLSTNPQLYPDALSYLRAAQASDFLRKYPELPIPVDPAQKAEETWWACEKENFITNRRFNELMDFGTLSGVPAHEQILELISRIRKIVRRLIGVGPDEVTIPRFGPGATVSDKSGYTTVPDKITSTPTLTRGAEPFIVDWTSTGWSRAVKHLGRHLEYVRGNSFFTVPKTALTDRPCGKEPSFNVAFQLGLGRQIRQRLKRRGYDLDTLQEKHRAYARNFSFRGDHVTIDLSSASDRISATVVKLLMPNEWYRALNALRSPITKVRGKAVHLEKFSSMGNGFTFELETVIFLSIALALHEWEPCWLEGEVVSVYGDDIIVPTRIASNVIGALEFFGFSVNQRKTHVEGPFRESCGGDYYLGNGVRPYILDKVPNEPQDFISMANGIRRMAAQFPSVLPQDLRRTWFRIQDNVPARIRFCRGPEALGDLVFHDEERTWKARWRGQIRYLQVYRPSTYVYVRWEGFAYEVQYAAALYGVTLSGPGARKGHGIYLIPRDGVKGYKVGWAPFS